MLSRVLHAAALVNIVACVALWIRAKTVDQDERGNAERRALFLGLWPMMLWQFGDQAERLERRPASRARRLLR